MGPPTTDFQNADAVVNLLEEAATHCRNEKYRDHSVVRLPARGRLIATGDLHDNPVHFGKILEYARLDRSEHNHVYFHELIHGENLINGMDFSHRMLLRIAELKCRYPDQVHPILANHELSQLSGAGVTKGAGDSVEMFNQAVDWTFGDDAEHVSTSLNNFMRSWPIAIMTESGIMASHSLPAERSMPLFDPSIVNRDLAEDDLNPRTGSAYLMLWGRGHSDEHLKNLASIFGVTAFLLGHEHAHTGSKLVGKRALVLNSDHERGVILPINLTEEPDPEAWIWSAVPLGALPD